MKILSYFSFSLMFIFASCISGESEDLELYSHLLVEIQKNEKGKIFCPDSLFIAPLYYQFRDEIMARRLDWDMSSVEMEQKIYATESKTDQYIRSLENGFKWKSKSISFPVEKKEQCFQKVFFSGINDRIIYALVIDGDKIVERNSKIVTYKGSGKAYLFLVSEDESKIIDFIKVSEVPSFIPEDD